MKTHSFSKPNKGFLRVLGREIARLRKQKKLTIEEFAEMSDLHSKYIQTIERGSRNISVSVFLKIASALKVSPPRLLAKILAAK